MVMVILFFVNYKLICVDEDNWTANTGDKPPFKNAIKWETE
jgi:hypothetical protein